MVAPPKADEDVRLLHRSVADLTARVSALLNMTGTLEGKVSGVFGAGDLKVIGSFAELRINAEGQVSGQQSKKNTTVVLTSSANPVATGVLVHFTASVASDAGGTMQFKINGAPFGPLITLLAGVAVSPNIATLNPGNHIITASYSGNYLYNPAQGSLTQIVSQAVPDMTIESSKNPAVGSSLHPPVAADRIFWRAFLTPPTPVPPAEVMTGKVQFFIDNHPWENPVTIEQINPNRYKADSVAWDASTEAYHYVIRANYLGNFNYRNASASLDQYVLSRVNVTLTISPNPAQPEDTIIMDVRVSIPEQQGPIPSGNVHVAVDGVAGDVLPLINGGRRFQIGPLDIGDYTLVAHYYGDSRYTASNTQHYYTRYP